MSEPPQYCFVEVRAPARSEQQRDHERVFLEIGRLAHH